MTCRTIVPQTVLKGSADDDDDDDGSGRWRSMMTVCDGKESERDPGVVCLSSPHAPSPLY